MTLDEAIIHCQEKSCSDTECAKEHKQLGEWLVELKQRREQEESVSEDLEKELDTWRHCHFHGRRDIFANGEYLERVSQLDLAKHFFELGMQVSNKTQKGEEL